jgi:hypothetical protein
VVLPEWALSFDPPTRQMILFHEHEHARARDPLLTAIGALGAVFMPWNPAIWMHLARLRAAIEIDCDARVVRRVKDPRTYASLLVAVGAQVSSRVSWLPALAERNSLLERRIIAISETRPLRPGLASLPAIAILAVCAFFAAGMTAPDPLRQKMHAPLGYPNDTIQGPQLRTLTATLDLQIASLTGGFYDLEVSRTGAILTLEDASIPRVFSPTGVEILRLDSGLPLDLRTLYWGWSGDAIWMLHTSAMEMIMVHPSITPPLVTSRPVPYATPGPPGTTPQRRSALAGGGVPAATSSNIQTAPARPVATQYRYPDIRAMYPDGGLLISQQFPPDEIRDALGYPPDAIVPRSLLVRTNAENQFVSYALRSPTRSTFPCRRATGLQSPSGPIERTLPFCSDLHSMLSPDGRRIVHVTTAIPVTYPAAIRVSQVDIVRNDTIYSRSYRVPTLAVTPDEADSVRAAEWDRLSQSSEPRLRGIADSILEHDMPEYRSPVNEVYTGNDGTVMLMFLRFTSARYYLLVDPLGNAVGTFTLPSNVLPVEVRGNAVYGLVPRFDAPASANLNDIVRYRIR